jgi:hypothetical protein
MSRTNPGGVTGQGSELVSISIPSRREGLLRIELGIFSLNLEPITEPVLDTALFHGKRVKAGTVVRRADKIAVDTELLGLGGNLVFGHLNIACRFVYLRQGPLGKNC